ncbi:MAG: DNA repair protein [Alphaproteobacteria bacterium]|nr:DNA repair protein [Alphaproteobacteria bacterium]
MNKTYICIDLKSFYASVECVARGLDPFKVNLVVADSSRGPGAITLAITPAMKKLGIKNRCRLFEIPNNVNYITALPRMKLYMETSAKIYGVYIKYISPKDMHPYSIDEVFIDATNYLHIYNKTPKELALMLMNAVFNETGICATAGIGTNLFLAKVALDVTAKHVPDHIGFLDENSYLHSLANHQPLTDIWNIGQGTVNRLNKYGIVDLEGIRNFDEDILYKEFGITAEFLIDHAWGREPCEIKDIKAYKSKTTSLSNSQILFEDYNFEDAFICLEEMVDNLSIELFDKNLLASGISLFIGYSRDTILPTGGSKKLANPTNLFSHLIKEFKEIYLSSTNKEHKIRKLSISFNNLIPNSYRNIQLDLFNDTKADEQEQKIIEAISKLKQKYGKNIILRAISYQNKATARIRNTLIGGHNG